MPDTPLLALNQWQNSQSEMGRDIQTWFEQLVSTHLSRAHLSSSFKALPMIFQRYVPLGTKFVLGDMGIAHCMIGYVAMYEFLMEFEEPFIAKVNGVEALTNKVEVCLTLKGHNMYIDINAIEKPCVVVEYEGI